MRSLRRLVRQCDHPSVGRGGMPRAFVVAVAAAALFVGCSSSDESAGDTAAAPEPVGEPAEPADDVVDAGVGEASLDDAAAQPPDEEPADAASRVMTISTDLGESWTTEVFSCSYTPDETGPFAQLWAASATLDPDGQLTLFEANPPDPAHDGTVIVGDLVDDAAGKFYVAIEASAVSDGSTLTITVGMHDSPLKVVGDPIDLTATVTCPL